MIDRFRAVAALALIAVVAPIRAQESTGWRDPSPHRIQFVNVDENVRLEVVDWGGVGRPVVLLAGLGNIAHVFDDFAPKLTPEYHVYGITRRGYGASTAPASGYEVDRLGDDVLAVLDALKLKSPVLAEHSIAGQELSSVATRYPDRILGLVYLDAANQYAFDDGQANRYKEVVEELQKNLQELLRRGPWVNAAESAVRAAVAAFSADFAASQEKVAKAFEKGVPKAKVVQLPGANHLVFMSNETDVLREMRAFLAGLQ